MVVHGHFDDKLHGKNGRNCARIPILLSLEDYRVLNDPMKYQDEKFYWSYQCGIHWPIDYIGPASMTPWTIEGSVGFTDMGLYKISESVRA